MNRAMESVNEKIHINQIGYRPKDKKVVIINDRSGKFEIVDANSGKTVFKGETYGAVDDAASGDIVSYGDFSAVQKPGEYYVVMPKYGRSYNFKIDNRVYKDLKNTMLRSLYFQRCGMELEEKYAGVWKHGKCHCRDGYVYGSNGVRKDGTGGWHDAGDYGKFVVPASKAVTDLMLAYEFFPEAFREETNIPESGNGIPDILNELRYELEWILKMQDEASGGVHHKLTTTVFPEIEVMPENDIADQYFCAISSTATADFAAVTAMASRVYGPIDREFSARCLAAAEKAWGWILENKIVFNFCNPPGFNTGPYTDTDDRDERLWAAAELYRTTGKSEYHDYFRAAYYGYFKLAYNEYFNPDCKEYFSQSYHQYFETSYKYRKYDKYGLGWDHNGGFAAIAYLFTDRSKVDEGIYNGLMNEFLNVADDFVQVSKKEGYLISLGINEYWWGSNSNVMNRTIHLIVSSLLKPNDEYIQTAQEHLHYLLGRNALDQCYITEFGSKQIAHLHHRMCLDKKPIPGMVLGGPNSRLQDMYAINHLQGVPPARCFADNEMSWSTNQMTIYWNTPAVFIAGYFDRE